MKKTLIRLCLLAAVVTAAPLLSSCYGAGVAVVDTYDEPPTYGYYDYYGPRAGHVWIDGRWVWFNNRWTWRRGHWVASRPGFIYTQGYWHHNGYRWVWIDGRWVNNRPGFIYARGYWSPRHRRWVRGRWIRSRTGQRWVSGRYIRNGKRRTWSRGRWQVVRDHRRRGNPGKRPRRPRR